MQQFIFQQAAQMSYANTDQIKNKAEDLYKKLIEYLKTLKKDELLFFEKGEMVYIPDIHGDFVHLIITLYRHGLLEGEVSQPRFHLRNDYDYVFLGDFYDRAPDSDVIDFWLNEQIKRGLKIYRLIGNHEIAFFERDANNYPVIFPSQDSIKDISNNFRITENLLKNIADGNILAAYVDRRGLINQTPTTLYVHSYVVNEDYIELGLEPNSDIFNFATALNERFKKHGQYAYDLFLEHKKDGKYDWEKIMQSFNEDPLFTIYKKRFDISTSFLWRRTGVATLSIYPVEIDVDIPNDVYQIVGHTPIFLFDLPRGTPINKPFILCRGDLQIAHPGKIQFSDVGIGYYYKSDFERPEVVINKKLSISPYG